MIRKRLWQLTQLEDRSVPSVTAPPRHDLPPSANDDFADTNGTNAVRVEVLENDAAVGSRSLVPGSVALVSLPAHGKVTIDPATGALTYTALGFSQGTDSFRYTVTDSSGAVSNVAVVTIVVNRPTAADDFAETTNTAPVDIDVLANDTDPDGNAEIDPTSVRLVSLPKHGSAVVRSNGEVTYTADTGFIGTDTFTYTITDSGGGESGPGSVTIVVSGTAASTSPIARDDVADTDGTNPVAVEVLTNDSASAGFTLDPASVKLVNPPTHGGATVDLATGTITYTGTGFYAGTDAFTYNFRDSNGKLSNTARVSIIVNRPVANDDFADTDGNNPVTIDVLANDTDPDGNNELDASSVKVVSPPLHGTVGVASSGAITYTAIGSFTGTDTFRYTVTDNAGAESPPGTVTVVVNRPTANPDSASTTVGEAVTIAVLANDTDPDGSAELDAASVALVSGPSHGSVTFSDGVATYTPSGTYIGTDVFTYTVTDFPGATSNAAAVRVRINADAAHQIIVAGADSAPRVIVSNADGSVRASFFAYDPAFRGGVSVATGDVTGDGVPDIVTAAGPGGGPHVKVFDGATLALLDSFFAYDPKVTTGVSVAVADVNGDGLADIVTAPGTGGGPHVKVFDGFRHTGQIDTLIALPPETPLLNFFAYNPTFTGGVSVATGDVNGDGRADVITAPARKAAGGHVKVFDGATGSVLRSFFAYDLAYSGGVSVTAADFNGDGLADIATGARGASHVKVFDGLTNEVRASFFAYDIAFRGGVNLAAGDANGDGTADLLVSHGRGADLPTRVYDGSSFAPLRNDATFAGFQGGVYVGAAG